MRLLPSDAWPEKKELHKGVLEQYVALRATNEQHETARQRLWEGTLHSLGE